MTAHRLLYKSIQKRDGTFVHIPRDSLPVFCRLIVVDEVSMLPQVMWDLLLSHGIYVIACGDPGQLPPVAGSTEVLDHPHVFLDEIMRQAADSEIIRLSSNIREGIFPKPGMGSEVNIVRYRDFYGAMLFWADQVICGKNNTRHNLNDFIRKEIYGNNYTTYPVVGDKVICLKNNWDKVTSTGDALVNGCIGTLENLTTQPNPYLGVKAYIDFKPEGYEDETCFHDLLIDWKLITERTPTITKENFRTFPKNLRPEQFDYGYCITCHKSQGSEYGKVLVLEEMLKDTDHKRWLYTAVTRAANKLTLVLKD